VFECLDAFCDFLAHKELFLSGHYQVRHLIRKRTWFPAPSSLRLVNRSSMNDNQGSGGLRSYSTHHFGGNLDSPSSPSTQILIVSADYCSTPLPPSDIGGCGSLRSPLAALAAYSSVYNVSNLNWLSLCGWVGLEIFCYELFEMGASEMILGISDSYAGCFV